MILRESIYPIIENPFLIEKTSDSSLVYKVLPIFGKKKKKIPQLQWALPEADNCRQRSKGKTGSSKSVDVDKSDPAQHQDFMQTGDIFLFQSIILRSTLYLGYLFFPSAVITIVFFCLNLPKKNGD